MKRDPDCLILCLDTQREIQLTARTVEALEAKIDRWAERAIARNQSFRIVRRNVPTEKPMATNGRSTYPNLDTFRTVKRVQLHPATDLWAQGARYADVLSIGWKYVHIKLDAGREVEVLPKDILPLETRP